MDGIIYQLMLQSSPGSLLNLTSLLFIVLSNLPLQPILLIRLKPTSFFRPYAHSLDYKGIMWSELCFVIISTW